MKLEARESTPPSPIGDLIIGFKPSIIDLILEIFGLMKLEERARENKPPPIIGDLNEGIIDEVIAI
tara:strand:+ start:3611 stop:3808 length:198 start_codon:yes stop_codon:yes gene_type:complete